MRKVLPFVKVAVLTAVPALITGGIVRLKKETKVKLGGVVALTTVATNPGKYTIYTLYIIALVQ